MEAFTFGSQPINWTNPPPLWLVQQHNPSMSPHKRGKTNRWPSHWKTSVGRGGGMAKRNPTGRKIDPLDLNQVKDVANNWAWACRMTKDLGHWRPSYWLTPFKVHLNASQCMCEMVWNYLPVPPKLHSVNKISPDQDLKTVTIAILLACKRLFLSSLQ